MGPTYDRMLISEYCTAWLQSDKSVLSGYNLKNKQHQSQPDCLIRHCLISEFGAACSPSYRYRYMKSDLHSVLKQGKTRKLIQWVR